MDQKESIMNPAISVVIPVYNTGDYLLPSVTSVLEQDFKDFEVILVDDGSTDGSSSLCDSFARDDSRLKCIHKANEGVIKALDVGVRAAEGRWIAFVDHDDTLPQNALSTLYNHTSDVSDIIVGFSYPGDGSLRVIPIMEWRKLLIKSDVILCTRWAKLYKKEILEEGTMHASPSIKMGEDMIMNIKASFHTEKPVTIINEKVYEYNRNQRSFSVRFKRTADWSYAIYNEIKNLIPEGDSALQNSLISNGIGMVRNVVLKGSYKDCSTLANSSFIEELRRDISLTGYHMTRIEKALIKTPESVLVRSFVRFLRVLEIVKKKWKDL